MLKRLFGGARPSRVERAREATAELDNVFKQMRQLGQRATLEQFEASPLVVRLASSGPQLCQLANMIYQNADDNATEVQKALLLWRKAIDNGSEPAKFSYAMCMKKGIGFETPDAVGAVKYFQELAATGHGWGSFAYADALSTGDGTRKNEKKAFELFQRCADANIPPAFLNVANMLTSGTGVAKNERAAVKYLHKAADANDPTAKARLGELYFHGKHNVVEKDVKRALELYTDAAARGVASAQFNLGCVYLTGDAAAGIKQHELLAETLFRKAADQGFVMAMVNLAQLYRFGYGRVPQNVDVAAKWLELAAPHDPNANDLLQLMRRSDDVEAKEPAAHVATQ